MRIKYQKEEDRRVSAIKKEHNAKYFKALRVCREAREANEARSAKILKNPDLAETLPIIQVPEAPERTQAIIPKRARRVVKFKQHRKADVRDLR